MSFLAACIQLRSTESVEESLDRAEQLIRRAAAHGAALIATPENTPFLGSSFHNRALAEREDGPIATRLAALAEELSVHLLIGSIAEIAYDEAGQADPVRCHNSSLFFSPEGALLAKYRKLHLFDVDVAGGPQLKESEKIVAGDRVVTIETPLAKIGLSICYDLRFPELYRALRDEGAELICVPSAFTLMTGKDHWHPLLRARAIETQSYVLAPGQWGRHDRAGKRESYGHSLIVDPWGTVIADQGAGEGISLAEIDLERVRSARASIPVSEHRRLPL